MQGRTISTTRATLRNIFGPVANAAIHRQELITLYRSRHLPVPDKFPFEQKLDAPEVRTIYLEAYESIKCYTYATFSLEF